MYSCESYNKIGQLQLSKAEINYDIGYISLTFVGDRKSLEICNVTSMAIINKRTGEWSIKGATTLVDEIEEFTLSYVLKRELISVSQEIMTLLIEEAEVLR